MLAVRVSVCVDEGVYFSLVARIEYAIDVRAVDLRVDLLERADGAVDGDALEVERD